MTLEEKLNLSLDIALAKKQMNRAKLAEKMGCSKSYISKVMAEGRLSVSKLDEISQALGFKIWEFTQLGDS